MKRPEFIQIGKILSTHGLKGFVKINPYINEFLDLVNEVKILTIKDTEFKVESIIFNGKVFLVKFENINSIEDTKILINQNISIFRDKIKLELIPEDILDNEIYDNNLMLYGKAIDFGDYGSGVLINIKKINEEQEFIPFEKFTLAQNQNNETIVIIKLSNK